MDDRNHHHAVEMDVLRVDWLSRDLGLGVEALEGLADVDEAGGVLERRVLRDPRGFDAASAKVAKGHPLPDLCDNNALGDDDLACRNTPGRPPPMINMARDPASLAILKERIGDQRRGRPVSTWRSRTGGCCIFDASAGRTRRAFASSRRRAPRRQGWKSPVAIPSVPLSRVV